MDAKSYKFGDKEFEQQEMNVLQYQEFFKLMQKLGLGAMISSGNIDGERLLRALGEQGCLLDFLSLVLVEKGHEFATSSRKRLESDLSKMRGGQIAQVVEDFLSLNDEARRRLTDSLLPGEQTWDSQIEEMIKAILAEDESLLLHRSFSRLATVMQATLPTSKNLN